MIQGSKVAVRLNLGCGGRPLADYINVDMDSLDRLRERYPQQKFSDDIVLKNYDIFHLPFEDGGVDEVRADSMIEHLSFLEESKFFYEIKRVLKPGGVFEFSVPDFEATVRAWLEAKDEWKEFFRNDSEAIAQEHWFGNYSYSTENRWGYLTAMIFGPQNGEGQFHKNCYTVPKVKAILGYLEFEIVELSQPRWKGNRDVMIQVRALKSGR